MALQTRAALWISSRLELDEFEKAQRRRLASVKAPELPVRSSFGAETKAMRGHDKDQTVGSQQLCSHPHSNAYWADYCANAVHMRINSETAEAITTEAE